MTIESDPESIAVPNEAPEVKAPEFSRRRLFAGEGAPGGAFERRRNRYAGSAETKSLPGSLPGAGRRRCSSIPGIQDYRGIVIPDGFQ